MQKLISIYLSTLYNYILSKRCSLTDIACNNDDAGQNYNSQVKYVIAWLYTRLIVLRSYLSRIYIINNNKIIIFMLHLFTQTP